MIFKNVCRGHALRIAVGIIALSISWLLGWANALSKDGCGSWLYRRDITINN